MFTVKYRTYVRAPQQPSDGPVNYAEQETLSGPFEFVSSELDEEGRSVVYAHRDDGPSVTYGPVFEIDDLPMPRPIVWVMNAQGATVGTYHL